MTAELQERWLRGLAAAVWLAVVAGAAAWLIGAWPSLVKAVELRYIRQALAEQRPGGALAHPAAPAWPAPVAPPPEDWSAVRRARGKGGVTVLTGPLQRFRLAGTFTVLEGAAAAPGDVHRRAVIDDLQKQTEYLLREGEAVEGFTLLKIFPDRVTAQINGRDEELRLSFTDAVAAEAAAAPPAKTNEVVLATSRYGKRIAQDRWVMSREALLQYYEELRKDPERVLQLFDSMQPSYTAEKNIDGYRLHMEGEKEFFQAVGLQEGDVVRKVNSMNMTSQRRAESFISAFLQNQVSAIVFDIEREGKAQKLIYFLR